ncbi:MAG: hypothetical protein DRP74_08105 [Candidatus Omnitrophota bacterium]|nr:MAG: hypothetical protein DRP74_08105 [Candidatus Omnitrophota bacterium]
MAWVTKVDINNDGYTAVSSQVEQNIDNIINTINGNLDETNISTSSLVCVADRDMTITGSWTFSTNPTFNNNAIPDSALSNNVALKDQANTFSALQTFSAGIDLQNSKAQNFAIEEVSSLPTPTPDMKGRIVEMGDNAYLCTGSAWKNMTYTGTYIGGAVFRYEGERIIDDQNSRSILIKKDSSHIVATLFIKGDKFPTYMYLFEEHKHPIDSSKNATITLTVSDPGHFHTTVLGSHTHSGSFATSNHTHQVYGATQDAGSHKHTYSGTTSDVYIDEATTGGISLSHHHDYSGETSTAENHQHVVNITSSSPSAYASVGSTDLGSKDTDSKTTGISISGSIGGSTESQGINSGATVALKTYIDSMQIQINGIDITQWILNATNWTQIGDGTNTHAFITTGGELEIYRKVSNELIGTGDGTTTTFNYTASYLPIKKNSISIIYTIGGITYTATDDGAGTISGTNCSGTVNYDTGAISLTFTTAPDNGTNIEMDYEKGWLNDGMNTITFIEPTANSGGTVLYHIELS